MSFIDASFVILGGHTVYRTSLSIRTKSDDILMKMKHKANDEHWAMILGNVRKWVGAFSAVHDDVRYSINDNWELSGNYMRMRSSLVRMRSSLVRMRSSLVAD